MGKKPKVDDLIQLILDAKIAAMKTIVDRPATYHALNVAITIAGWELAAFEKHERIDGRLVKKIYLEAAN